MTKNSKKRVLELHLNDLQIKRKDLCGKIPEIPNTVYEFYVLYSLSQSCLKSKNKEIINSKKYFNIFSKWLVSKGIEIHKYNNGDRVDIDIKKNGLYIYNYLGFNELFRLIRNSLAHGNVISYNKKIMLFGLEKSITKMNIDTILNTKLVFILIIDNIKFLQ